MMSENFGVRDRRRQHFFIIDNALIDTYGDRIGVYGIAVYSVLARFAGNRDEAWPSYQTVADRLGISRRKVIDTIDLLIHHGLIEKEVRKTPSGDHASNIYILLSPGHDGGAQNALGSRGGGAQHALPGAQDAPEEEILKNTSRKEDDLFPKIWPQVLREAREGLSLPMAEAVEQVREVKIIQDDESWTIYHMYVDARHEEWFAQRLISWLQRTIGAMTGRHALIEIFGVLEWEKGE